MSVSHDIEQLRGVYTQKADGLQTRPPTFEVPFGGDREGVCLAIDDPRITVFGNTKPEALGRVAAHVDAYRRGLLRIVADSESLRLPPSEVPDGFYVPENDPVKTLDKLMTVVGKLDIALTDADVFGAVADIRSTHRAVQKDRQGWFAPVVDLKTVDHNRIKLAHLRAQDVEIAILNFPGNTNYPDLRLIRNTQNGAVTALRKDSGALMPLERRLILDQLLNAYVATPTVPPVLK